MLYNFPRKHEKGPMPGLASPSWVITLHHGKDAKNAYT